MTFRSNALAVTALLAAMGCGDGTNVHLGVGPQLQLPPDGSGGSGGGAPGEAGPDTSGDGASCDGSAVVQPEVAAFLTECEGFGCKASGGRDGCRYEVTTDADDGPGSLREALALVRPAWITFSANFDIILRTGNLQARSHKTIDGRNRKVTIRDLGIRIENAENIVIENITFLGRKDLDPDAGVRKDDADAISLVGSSTRNVWIDHCDFSNYPDGLIDICGGATDVTISRSHFSDHDRVMLFGNDVDDLGAREMRVTVHHNWLEMTKNYHPRVRYGWVHVYNNLFDRWGDVGVRASQLSRVYTERNIYRADEDSKEAVVFTKEGDDDQDGFVRAAGGDLKLNLAEVNANDDGTHVEKPGYTYLPDTADDGGDAGGLLEQRLRAETGIQAPLP